MPSKRLAIPSIFKESISCNRTNIYLSRLFVEPQQVFAVEIVSIRKTSSCNFSSGDKDGEIDIFVGVVT